MRVWQFCLAVLLVPVLAYYAGLLYAGDVKQFDAPEYDENVVISWMTIKEYTRKEIKSLLALPRQIELDYKSGPTIPKQDILWISKNMRLCVVIHIDSTGKTSFTEVYDVQFRGDKK